MTGSLVRSRDLTDDGETTPENPRVLALPAMSLMNSSMTRFASFVSVPDASTGLKASGMSSAGLSPCDVGSGCVSLFKVVNVLPMLGGGSYPWVALFPVASWWPTKCGSPQLSGPVLVGQQVTLMVVELLLSAAVVVAAKLPPELQVPRPVEAVAAVARLRLSLEQVTQLVAGLPLVLQVVVLELV